MDIVAQVVAGLFVIATLLPVLPCPNRWVRSLDFPRIQISAGLGISGAALAPSAAAGSTTSLVMAGLVALALLYQLSLIAPYTRLFAKQAGDAAPGPDEVGIRILIANVMMENRAAGDLLRMVERTDTDIALFVETDIWWDDALSGIAESHPHTLRRLQDNHYGMLLFSRLELVKPEIRFLIRDEIPSIRTGIRLKSGHMARLYGLHPVPPPLADTRMRDAEILVVAREIRDTDVPAIVAGDLNDVSWSHTTRMFVRISRLVDPRIGRGLFASYNAKNPLMRWPLDHIFHHGDFKVRDVRLMESCGSDHFPVFIDLAYQPKTETGKAAPDADGHDMKEAEEKIRDGETAVPADDDYPQQPSETR